MAKMTDKQRLDRIAEIIEAVDQRCLAADGPVPSTMSEMTQEEMSEIYKLSTRKERGRKSRNPKSKFRVNEKETVRRRKRVSSLNR